MTVLSPSTLQAGAGTITSSLTSNLTSFTIATSTLSAFFPTFGFANNTLASASVDTDTIGFGFGPGKIFDVDFRQGNNIELLLVPFGLILLFFGTFLLKPALIAWCYLHHGVIIGLLSTVILQLAGDKMTGFVMGFCIAFTLPKSHLHLLVVIIFALSFGKMYILAPRHVTIITTAYGGAFIMFYGMALIDGSSFQFLSSSSFDLNLDVMDFSLHDLMKVPDLAFSVLSFLIIGLLGAGVQLMLLASQHQLSERHLSQSQYVRIP